MNVVDIIIIIMILLGFVVGFKRGFTKELVSFAGFILIFIIAFFLKTPLSHFLFKTMPFFSFDGIFKGITSLNILVYEVLAFFIVLSVLMIIFKLLIFATGIFEKFLDFTIILGLPSKILGGVLGIVQGFVIVYIFLYITMLPFFSIPWLNDSFLAKTIRHKSPILSQVMKATTDVFDDVKGLTDQYKVNPDTNAFNKESLDIMLKYKIIDVESVKMLDESGKMKINGIDTIISKYEKKEAK